MTARDLDELLQEQTAYERKCQIISEIAAYIDGMSNQAAYRSRLTCCLRRWRRAPGIWRAAEGWMMCAQKRLSAGYRI